MEELLLNNMLMGGRTNIVKMPILPKSVYKFITKKIKTSMANFREIEQGILRPQIVKAIEKEE